MGYFLAFGLVYIGYSLVDWGHYILNHEDIPLWWLMSGLGTPPPAINVFPVADTPPIKPGGAANPLTGSRLTPAGFAQTPKYTRTTK